MRLLIPSWGRWQRGDTGKRRRPTGSSPQPWVRLYRHEGGTFRQLPLRARAVAAEVLKLAIESPDDPEVAIIDIGDRPPWQAIAFALGADRKDRALLRETVPMLLEDGYLVLEGDENEATSGEVPADFVSTSGEVPVDFRSGSGEVCERKPAKSHSPPKANGVPKPALEKRREEKRREEPPKGPPPESAPPPPTPSVRQRIGSLQERYPPELVAEARAACALTRRNGRMADSVWLRTLESMTKHPAPQVVDAMRTYVERYGDGEKDERYLLGIVRRNGSGPQRRPGFTQPAAPAEFEGGDNRSDWRSFMDPDQLEELGESDWETREAAHG